MDCFYVCLVNGALEGDLLVSCVLHCSCGIVFGTVVLNFFSVCYIAVPSDNICVTVVRAAPSVVLTDDAIDNSVNFTSSGNIK